MTLSILRSSLFALNTPSQSLSFSLAQASLPDFTLKSSPIFLKKVAQKVASPVLTFKQIDRWFHNCPKSHQTFGLLV